MTRLVWFLTLTVPMTSARAESPLLDKARAKIEAFELELALELLDVLLEDPASQRQDRTAAHALKGRILVGHGCNKTTVANYHALLKLDPGFELPATESPKVRQCFTHARATAPPPPKPPPPPPDPKPDPDPEPVGPTTPLDPGEDDDSVLTAWWLWTGVACAVAVTVLSIVLVSESGAEPIRGNLGHATNWPP